MKKLLLLGGSRYLLPVIREAHDLGLYVITCDYLPDNDAHPNADEYRNVSIIDKEAVLALARELKIDGVMSFACDPGVTTAAYVAEQLGLPSVGSFEAVSILQDKARFRRFLTEHGFTVPRAKGYTCPEDALADAGRFAYPVIVKPVDSAGSKGVTRVDGPEALPGALDLAFRVSLGGRVIVEDFIRQKGFASDTDCFSVDGQLRFVSYSCQHFDPKADNPYAPSGYSWPSTMSASAQAELTAELQRLITLLGLGTSVFNVETREGTDGRAYIMECSPRGGGNRLSEVLELATGARLVRNSVLAAIGAPVEPLPPADYQGAWAELILHSDRDGRFAGLDIREDVRPFVREEDLWVHPGDRVEQFSGANKAIGTLVLRFDHEEQLQAYMASPDDWVRVVVQE